MHCVRSARSFEKMPGSLLFNIIEALLDLNTKLEPCLESLNDDEGRELVRCRNISLFSYVAAYSSSHWELFCSQFMATFPRLIAMEADPCGIAKTNPVNFFDSWKTRMFTLVAVAV